MSGDKMRIQEMRRLVERSVNKMTSSDIDALKKDVEKKRASVRGLTDIPLIKRSEHLARRRKAAVAF